MTNAKIQESLGRLSCLKWFPTNTYALVAIAEILRDLCPTDDDATVLVQKMLGGFDEGPGPESLRKTHALILEGRRAVERANRLREAYIVAGAARKVHEAACSGYSIDLDGEALTVSVARCRQRFGRTDIEQWQWLYCRKGEALNAEFLRQVQEAELAARPGWITLDAYYAQRLRERRPRLAAWEQRAK